MARREFEFLRKSKPIRIQAVNFSATINIVPERKGNTKVENYVY